MATYYVDFVNGLDANNGLGPDASAVTNKPWKTIAKLLGAAGMASGDTAYLAPGAFRETVTVAMASATVETKVIGDPFNKQGFKTSGGVLVAPGDVSLTAFVTNDKTAAAGSALTLSARDFLTFQDIRFVTGTGVCVSAGAGSTDIKFTDCSFISGNPGSGGIVSFTGTAGVSSNWAFDRCRVLCPQLNVTGGSFVFTLPRHSADYNATISLTNCVIVGGSQAAVRVASNGAGAGFGGGVTLAYCTLTAQIGLVTADANLSTTYPCTVTGCILICDTGLSANTAGQITESYNVLWTRSARTNVTAGTGSQTTAYAMLVELGKAISSPGLTKPFLSPVASSPLLGFSSAASPPAVDATNRLRPAGGASALPAVGAFERGNTFITDPSPIGAGGSAIKVTGPGYAEFLVPVPARAITISCKVKWDATYAGTKPQLQIDANGTIGVLAETITATVAATNIETLTLTAFTPTAAGGMVRIRILSNDTNGAGVLQVDDFSVTG